VLLSEQKCDINYREKLTGNTALHLAVELAHLDIVKLLLVGDPTIEQDLPQADVDIQNNSGRTPLMMVLII
jgi:ankyrin repeat protein